MRAPLGDLNPFLTSSASQCFLLWGKEAARLRVDGETCTGERMRPGRIQLICGRPKIIEHLCAKDWTVLTDLLLIWLQHRLLFPWHHRSLSLFLGRPCPSPARMVNFQLQWLPTATLKAVIWALQDHSSLPLSSSQTVLIFAV
ncbi:protein FAM156A/FAM156B isoform X3 [Cavia porcellus]|uniref:protein FAM156A/FAM156B isoform X3 n=1 Tax=Cavia porcellus TaxID=10141 RepID=UPI002FE3B315